MTYEALLTSLAVEQRFWIVVLLSTSGFGLLTIWAAHSRLPWPHRSLVIGCLLSLLLRIGAYEPIIFFLIQLGVTLSAFHFWPIPTPLHKRATPHKRAFTLQTLMWSIAIFGVVLAITIRTKVPSTSVWINLLAGGAACGVATWLAAWIAAGPPWPWKRGLSTAAILAIVALPMTLTDSLLLHFPNLRWSDTFAGQSGQPFPYQFYFGVWFNLLASLCTGLYVCVGLWRMTFADKRFRRQGSFVALRILVVSLVCANVIFYLHLPSFPNWPVQELPQPNGYDKFFEASELLVEPPQSQTVDNASDLQLRTCIDTNQRALATLDSSLQHPWALPIGGEAETTMERLRRVRRCQRMLSYRIELAKRERRFNDMLLACLEHLEFGRRLQTNTILIDAQGGRTFDWQAFQTLAETRTQLNSQQLQEMVKKLIDIEKDREPFDDIRARDRRWAICEGGWPLLLYGAICSDSDLERVDSVRSVWPRASAISRLLLVDAHVRLHLATRGELPNALEELPLKRQLMVDPYSRAGDPLRYRKMDDSFVLYSIGPDQSDADGDLSDYTLDMVINQ